MWKKSRFAKVMIAICLGFAGLSPAFAQSGSGPSDYQEKDCYVGGLIGKMRCYTLVRPLSQDNPGTITLGGVIVPSDAVVPEADPLVILAGGPGQAASDMAAPFGRLFSKIQNNRDLIFFDIRGSGKSNPVSCSNAGDDFPPLTDIGDEKKISLLRECFSGQESILRTFTTRTAVADLEALRVALGVEQLNLWGGSYGTRLAQYYIYAHPTRVRSAVLDAVVPFTPSYLPLYPGHALDILNRVTAACAEDDACATAFPDFDPVALLDKIGENRKISYRHPVTGRPVTTITSRAVVAQALWGALYDAGGRAFIPYALTEAVEADNWGPMSVMALDAAKYMGVETIYLGPYVSTTCAEEKSSIDELSKISDPLFRGAVSADMKASCDIWPAASEPLPAPADGAFGMPAIMISGGYDPITPPVLAEYAAKAFSNVRHIQLKKGGHVNSRVPCITEFITAFIKDPLDETLASECIGDGHVPAFVIGPAGPAVKGAAQ